MPSGAELGRSAGSTCAQSGPRLPAAELAEHEDVADSLNVVLTRQLNCGYSTTAGLRGLAEGRVPSGAGA